MCNEGVSQCAIKTALHNNCWSDEKNSLRNRLKNKVYLTWCEINYRVAPKDYFNSTFVETTNRSFLLSRNKHGTKNKFEAVHLKMPRKWMLQKTDISTICPSLRSMWPTVSGLFAETFQAPL